MPKDESLREKPLKGVRVLDCSWATAGPYGSLLLALLGAEVIKIETPPTITGISTRQMIFPQYSHEGEDIHFLTYNRNKKSIVIDLQSPEGKAVFYDLMKKSDVVYDNFRPGVTKRLGIDYETLRKLNPRIICTSCSGFGATGPDIKKPAFDTIIEASSGVTYLLSELLPKGITPPYYPGVPIADNIGGLTAAFATVIALYAREYTGEGRMVDIAMQDMLISIIGYLLTGAANFKPFEDPMPKALWGAFKAKDNYIMLCGHREGMWRNLTKALGHEEWQTDARYNSAAKRMENGAEIRSMVEEVLSKKTAHEWLKILAENDVPCTSINTLEEVINNPQVLARNMIVSFNHKGKEIRAPGNPLKMSDLEETFESPPALGQHTDELLSEVLNYPQEKIAELKQKGVVA